MNREHIDLITQAKIGDMESFASLYRIYYKRVFSLSYSILRNISNAEDIVQDTFFTAWKRISTIKDPEGFNAWIQKIAYNLCYSLLRKKSLKIIQDAEEETMDVPEEMTSEFIPSAYLERDDLRERLNAIINKLSDVQKQTITLHYFNELSVQEIAYIMDCNLSTAKSRLQFGRKAIRLEIEEWEQKTGERFYGIAGIPMLPMGEVIAAQLQSSLINQAASESMLAAILSSISETAPTPMPEIPEPPQPPTTAQPSAVSNAVHPAEQALVSASKGLTPLSKLLVSALAVTAIGTAVYFATQGNLNNGEPQSNEITQVTEGLQMAEDTQMTGLLQEGSLFENAYIVWSDSIFESAVRASMQIPEDPIAVSAAEQEKELALVFSQGDVSLSDLKHFPKLEILDLVGGGRALDLSPLAKLNALGELHIVGAQASDLAQLADLPALKWLSLTNTNISDPTWLSKLPDLELLHLSGVNTFDLNILKSLSKLESLRITNSGLSDLTALAGMRSLKWLSVENTPVSDLSPLGKLFALKWLNVSGTKVTDLSPVTSRANSPHIVADGLEIEN